MARYWEDQRGDVEAYIFVDERRDGTRTSLARILKNSDGRWYCQYVDTTISSTQTYNTASEAMRPHGPYNYSVRARDDHEKYYGNPR